MDIAELKRFVPGGRSHILKGIADSWHYAEDAGINSAHRICHFMAQIAHESDSFRAIEEYASGAAYDTGRLATRLGNTPEADGDGQRYKGRGPIQITGLDNYKTFLAWCRKRYPDCPDFVRYPERVGEFPWAFLAAVWYWDTRKLNTYADKNDIRSITKRINGGYNGLADRRAKFRKAVAIWGNGEVREEGSTLMGTRTVKASLLGGGSIGLSGGLGIVSEARMAMEDGQGIAEALGVSWPLLAVTAIALCAIGYIVYDRWFIHRNEGL